MQQADKPEMVRILVGLAEMKPGGKITPEALDLWFLSLADWTLDEFRAAAVHLMKHAEFFPNPFHFEQLRKANRMTAGEAWAAAVQHARGAWRSGPAVPEVERAVQAIGGWMVLAHANIDSLQFIERRFTDAFADLETAVATREALPQIAGPTLTWKGRLSGPAPVADLVGRLKAVKDA